MVRLIRESIMPVKQVPLPIASPLFVTPVPAGFPSPADDYLENQLDLNKYLIRHPAATFFVRVVGDSMIGAGIHSGDILIVDRSLEPEENKVVIVILNGEFAVKRLKKLKGKLLLVSENDAYQPVFVEDGAEFEIWGIVTTVIHPV